MHEYPDSRTRVVSMTTLCQAYHLTAFEFARDMIVRLEMIWTLNYTSSPTSASSYQFLRHGLSRDGQISSSFRYYALHVVE